MKRRNRAFHGCASGWEGGLMRGGDRSFGKTGICVGGIPGGERGNLETVTGF